MATDKTTVEKRAEYAGRVVTAANALSKAAREVRDADATELLRFGDSPAATARLIGIDRAQIARMAAAERPQTATQVNQRADNLKAAVAALDAVLES